MDEETKAHGSVIASPGCIVVKWLSWGLNPSLHLHEFAAVAGSSVKRGGGGRASK